MKHLNYRLLACFLSFWMLFGALAHPASALTLSEINDYAEYSVTGDVTTQGPMPDDVIDVQLPTARANVLDVRLDPKNLLRDMGSNLQINGQTPRLGAGKVFFTNIDDSGAVSLTRNSDRLTIVNRCNIPLTVKMSVSVDKGNNAFTFASTPDFKDEKGKAISGPALYLALTTGPVRTPVLPIMTKDASGAETLSGYGATSSGWIADNQDMFHIGSNSSKTAYEYVRNDGVSDEDFTSTTFYMTGAMNTDGWDSMGSFSLSVTWKVGSVANITYEKGPDTDPSEKKDIQPWADTLFAASNASDAADLYVNFGSGANKMTQVAGIAYTTMGGKSVGKSASAANLTVEGSYVSVPATSEMYNGSGWMLVLSRTGGSSCRVPFSLKEASLPLPAPVADDDSPAVDVTTAASAMNDRVEMNVTLGPMTKVVSMTYVTSGGDENTVNNAQVLRIDGTSVSLNAFRGAWNGSLWRLNLEDDDGATASVYFDLKNAGKIEQPVVIVTTKAAAQNDTVILKVFMNNMTEITGLKYRTSGGSYNTVSHSTTAIFPQAELPEVKVAAFRGLWNGDRPSLEFKDDSGNTFSARFDIK